MSGDYVGLAMLSLFCAGGLFYYVPEALRLRRLLAAGVTRQATVRKKQRVESGSETVVHYLLTYEFTDERGATVVREDDLNDARFFEGLEVGARVGILLEPGREGNAYPADRVRTDARIAALTSAALLALWAGMGTYLLFA